jgi:5-methyltetrahydrofolate--homocysteine methyltransferase
MYAGLDLPIVNPNQSAVMDAIASFRVLSGEDRDSEAYIRRFANAAADAVPAAKSGAELSLDEAILRGLGAETAALEAGCYQFLAIF